MRNERRTRSNRNTQGYSRQQVCCCTSLACTNLPRLLLAPPLLNILDTSLATLGFSATLRTLTGMKCEKFKQHAVRWHPPGPHSRRSLYRLASTTYTCALNTFQHDQLATRQGQSQQELASVAAGMPNKTKMLQGPDLRHLTFDGKLT